jgi:hypothetical protein
MNTFYIIKFFLLSTNITTCFFNILFIAFKNNIKTEIHVNLHEKIIGVSQNCIWLKQTLFNEPSLHAKYNHTTVSSNEPHNYWNWAEILLQYNDRC